MKKLLSIVLGVMLVCSLAAPVFADADALEAVYASLTRKSLGADNFDAVVYDDLTLPTTDEAYGSVITWSSDNEAVISSSGEVTRGNETKSVVLTANISVGESRGTKAFSFRVPGIFDENYNGLTVMNEEFEGATTISKVVNNSKSTFSQADGYLNVANADSTVASRTDIYLKENKEGFAGNAALELALEREDKENDVNEVFSILNNSIKEISEITNVNYVDISEIGREENLYSKQQIYLNNTGQECVFEVFKEIYFN